MSTQFRDLKAHLVEQIAESWAVQYVRPAFAGDVASAQRLAWALSNEKRGAAAVAMWRAKVPRQAYTAYLKEVWLHDHDELLTCADRRVLHFMFRYADLPRPPDGAVVKVWRGATGCDPKTASSGFSWTLDRDIACWFAMRFACAKHPPIVLASEVPSGSIAWLTDEGNEREALILGRVRHAWIDGDPADWQLGAQRHTAKIVASNGAVTDAGR